MDVVTLALAKKGAKQYTDTVINNLPKGIIYKGSVNYYTDLPNDAEIGDCYTVSYTGESGSNPYGAEFVWGTNTATSVNEWTQIGQDLTDYVKNTDYATSSTGGVIKVDSFYGLNSVDNGKLRGGIGAYSDYTNLNDRALISKSYLETAITGKNLVSNTDYATNSTAGVLKINTGYGTAVYQGTLYATVKSYSEYQTIGDNFFIGAGTLKNVLDATVGDINSALDIINGEVI